MIFEHIDACSKPLSFICCPEDNGYFIISSDGIYGDVKGLYKTDVQIRGVRRAAGSIFYGGNDELGIIVNIEGEPVELYTWSVLEFFQFNAAQEGHVALLNAVSIDYNKVLMSAVSYIGAGRFIYASHIVDMRGIVGQSSLKREDESDDCNIEPDSVYRVLNVKANPSNYRIALYNEYVKDLSKLCDVSADNVIDILSSCDGYMLITSSGDLVSKQYTSSLGIVPKIDGKDVYRSVYIQTECDFSNGVQGCGDRNIECGGRKLNVREGVSCFVNDIENKKVLNLLTLEEGLFIEDITDVGYVAPLIKDKVYVNRADGYIFVHNKFAVPKLPQGTLFGQNEKIDSIVSIVPF